MGTRRTRAYHNN